MKSLEGADVPSKESKKEGRESMGLPAKKQKVKEVKSSSSFDPKDTISPRQKQKKAEQSPKMDKGSKMTKVEAKESSTPVKGKKEKKRAVEIPIPPSPAANEEDTAGLTSLQKGMKAKLEGARFRSVSGVKYLRDGLLQMDQRAAVHHTFHRSCGHDEEGPKDLR